MKEPLLFEWVCYMSECKVGLTPLRMRYATHVEAEVEYVRHKVQRHGLQVVPDWEQRIRALGTNKGGNEMADKIDVRIAILQRGWVMVGEFSKDGSQCFLRNASVVRYWGTTRGLGEIAAGGPTDKTELDPAGEVEFHELTAIALLRCNPEKWHAALKSR